MCKDMMEELFSAGACINGTSQDVSCSISTTCLHIIAACFEQVLKGLFISFQQLACMRNCIFSHASTCAFAVYCVNALAHYRHHQ